MNADLEQAKDYVARFVPHTLIPRMGRPADIAAAAAFLAADESEYITGQAFSVDGGHLAHQPQMGDMRSIERPCD
jgi:NAD(P)-dependent dehydrogenase (short-subunit alcohol dehydrogenase family)